MAFKLFVSYSDQDRVRIEPLLFFVRNMPERSNGSLDIFFYEESKTPSAKTTDEIVGKIRSSNAVLYFHSNNTVLSEFVQNEIGGAVVMDKQVIIAKLDETPVKGMLQGVNYLDFANPDVFKREINALLDTVKSKIGARQEKTDAALLATRQKPKTTFVQNWATSSPISNKTPAAIHPAYTIEDWQMILAIAAVITLTFFALKASK